MCPEIVSRIVSGDAHVNYWPILLQSLVTIPEVFAKVILAQFPSGFQSGELLSKKSNVIFAFFRGRA